LLNRGLHLQLCESFYTSMSQGPILQFACIYTDIKKYNITYSCSRNFSEFYLDKISKAIVAMIAKMSFGLKL
jgi:hypothetical protein